MVGETKDIALTLEALDKRTVKLESRIIGSLSKTDEYPKVILQILTNFIYNLICNRPFFTYLYFYFPNFF